MPFVVSYLWPLLIAPVEASLRGGSWLDRRELRDVGEKTPVHPQVRLVYRHARAVHERKSRDCLGSLGLRIVTFVTALQLMAYGARRDFQRAISAPVLLRAHHRFLAYLVLHEHAEIAGPKATQT